MQSKKPLISVIIPHLNQLEALEACLNSLEYQALERVLFEILVVDNGSSDSPESIVARHPGTRLLQELAPGPGLARNAGVLASNAEILCFIDADCRAHHEWLRTALQALASSPDKTILGGDVQIWRDNKSTFTPLEAYESVFGYRFKLYIEKHGYSGTGNLAVRRVDFDRVGPFGGILIAEDVEWGARARAAGFSFLYVPEMIVFHPARRSFNELFVKWDRHIQHALNQVREKPWWKTRWLARTLAVLASPVVDAGTVLFSKRLKGAPARTSALAVLVVLRSYRALRMLTLLFSRRNLTWNRSAHTEFADAKK